MPGCDVISLSTPLHQALEIFLQIESSSWSVYTETGYMRVQTRSFDCIRSQRTIKTWLSIDISIRLPTPQNKDLKEKEKKQKNDAKIGNSVLTTELKT